MAKLKSKEAALADLEHNGGLKVLLNNTRAVVRANPDMTTQIVFYVDSVEIVIPARDHDHARQVVDAYNWVRS